METNLDISKFIGDVKIAHQKGIEPYDKPIQFMQQLGRNIEDQSKGKNKIQVEEIVIDTSKQPGKTEGREER